MFNKLISWSRNHFSHLPWRTNRSLYGTLVSEIMLQQTTVGTVVNHFDKFLKKFPDLESLAIASDEEVLIAWSGLGYYRRARSLKKIAEQIVMSYQGKFPRDINHLLELDGVGNYTANALLAIGMNEKAIAVDANLERVLSRVYGIDILRGPKLTEKIYELYISGKILKLEKDTSFRDLNEALMDLGRTYCKANSVECQNCPLNIECFAFKNRLQLQIPRKKNEIKKIVHELALLRIIVKKENAVLSYRKKPGEWLENQWEIPTFLISTSDEGFSQYPLLPMGINVSDLLFFKSAITKYKIKNYVLEMSEKKFRKLLVNNDYSWREINQKSNFSTASIKALKFK